MAELAEGRLPGARAAGSSLDGGSRSCPCPIMALWAQLGRVRESSHLGLSHFQWGRFAGRPRGLCDHTSSGAALRVVHLACVAHLEGAVTNRVVPQACV